MRREQRTPCADPAALHPRRAGRDPARRVHGRCAHREHPQAQGAGRADGRVGHRHAVVEAVGAEVQSAIWHVRDRALNGVMARRARGSPFPSSRIAPCRSTICRLCRRPERAAGASRRRSSLYGHAGAGCLHLRPALNLRRAGDVETMRRLAEETFALVRRYGGTHAASYGDGLARSEFHAAMFGRKAARVFREVKGCSTRKDGSTPARSPARRAWTTASLFR